MRGFIAFIATAIVAIGGIAGYFGYTSYAAEQEWSRTCDGTSIVSNCTGPDSVRYSKYVYHEAQEAVTKEVYHPYVPAKTHTVHHDAIWGTRTITTCVKANIGKYKGQCAQSLCYDGTYSGSVGRGTCSYHGGVLSRGPWYKYELVPVLISEAWDETVIDTPAKEAYYETVIVSPEKDEYIEKVKA